MRGRTLDNIHKYAEHVEKVRKSIVNAFKKAHLSTVDISKRFSLNIHRLYRLGIDRYSDDPASYVKYIEYCITTNSSSKLKSVINDFIGRHPSMESTWILAATCQIEIFGGDVSAACLLLVKGMARCPKSIHIPYEIIKLFLDFFYVFDKEEEKEKEEKEDKDKHKEDQDISHNMSDVIDRAIVNTNNDPQLYELMLSLIPERKKGFNTYVDELQSILLERIEREFSMDGFTMLNLYKQADLGSFQCISKLCSALSAAADIGSISIATPDLIRGYFTRIMAAIYELSQISQTSMNEKEKGEEAKKESEEEEREKKEREAFKESFKGACNEVRMSISHNIPIGIHQDCLIIHFINTISSQQQHGFRCHSSVHHDHKTCCSSSLSFFEEQLDGIITDIFPHIPPETFSSNDLILEYIKTQTYFQEKKYYLPLSLIVIFTLKSAYYSGHICSCDKLCEILDTIFRYCEVSQSIPTISFISGSIALLCVRLAMRGMLVFGKTNKKKKHSKLTTKTSIDSSCFDTEISDCFSKYINRFESCLGSVSSGTPSGDFIGLSEICFILGSFGRLLPKDIPLVLCSNPIPYFSTKLDDKLEIECIKLFRTGYYAPALRKYLSIVRKELEILGIRVSK
ncbi:hypothetical protein ADUPG1_013770 [Aduncisulcus paluster]|uniref:Uncharacterized protein n=1 Tax=Aduncisulcus paluster TaxID=2918883 RepID=A0ABQ5K431_9EUKA|nr:hypothetical protein ADUPG1_013770 [Aduncisulcus paluster]